MKKLIVVTGIDGSGKSTLLKGIAPQIPDVYVANIWDLLESPNDNLPFQSKVQIDSFLCSLTPDSRVLFLAHALIWSTDKAIESGAKIVLANSYYYKYFATELVLGADPSLVQALIKRFPVPDQVLQLSLPLTVAVSRKKVLSRYECGLSENASPESFLRFQKGVISQWESFDQAHWYPLDATNCPTRLQQLALQHIKGL